MDYFAEGTQCLFYLHDIFYYHHLCKSCILIICAYPFAFAYHPLELMATNLQFTFFLNQDVLDSIRYDSKFSIITHQT